MFNFELSLSSHILYGFFCIQNFVRGEEMHWFVVFVKTGKEKEAVDELRKVLDQERFYSFVPLKELLYKKSGFVRREIHVLFPGYIFVETEDNSEACPDELFNAVKKSSFCHRVLNYGSYECSAMQQKEQNTILTMMNDEGVIEVSEALLEGDTVTILSGALMGCEDKIVTYDRHKRTAVIELDIMGREVQVVVAFNTLRKM